ncbi:MAG TPA: integrin, partial [Burkholderiales bacterium]|nr:integrin [Burkholderiales bacterium]
LSGDGNTLAVGAPAEASGSTGINSTPDESAAGAGAAYVFTRSAGTWTQQAYVKASNTGGSDDFGTSVALSRDGNALAVGAPREDGNGTGIEPGSDEGAANSGAVYFFSRSAGVWAQQSYVKATNTQSEDRFGRSVTLSGDGNALAVGAIGEDSDGTGIGGPQGNNNDPQSGAAYLY